MPGMKSVASASFSATPEVVASICSMYWARSPVYVALRRPRRMMKRLKPPVPVSSSDCCAW